MGYGRWGRNLCRPEREACLVQRSATPNRQLSAKWVDTQIQTTASSAFAQEDMEESCATRGYETAPLKETRLRRKREKTWRSNLITLLHLPHYCRSWLSLFIVFLDCSWFWEGGEYILVRDWLGILFYSRRMAVKHCKQPASTKRSTSSWVREGRNWSSQPSPTGLRYLNATLKGLFKTWKFLK